MVIESLDGIRLFFMNQEESSTAKPMDDAREEATIPSTPPPTEILSEISNLPSNLPSETPTPLQTADNLSILPATESYLNQAVESDTHLNSLYAVTTQRLADLQATETALKTEISQLQVTYTTLQGQVSETQRALSKIVEESLAILEQRRQSLQISVEQLERRQERIKNEMRTTFAGTSQDLAIRVQGFKDYLTGSLQDLVTAAEQLPLIPEKIKSVTREVKQDFPKEVKSSAVQSVSVQFAQQQFQETTKQINRLLEQYRSQPDYYGPPWQLRRTFEPVHVERVSNWFFTLGGRGALQTMSSRLQNVLISSAAVSILHKLYGDRLRTLILANSPERLGEWRRGLQDCLGIGRSDFGPDRGVVLFEAATALVQKADRLVKSNQMPLIIIDDSEEQVSLGLLQFPLWLAFAPDPKMMRDRYDEDF